MSVVQSRVKERSLTPFPSPLLDFVHSSDKFIDGWMMTKSESAKQQLKLIIFLSLVLFLSFVRLEFSQAKTSVQHVAKTEVTKKVTDDFIELRDLILNAMKLNNKRVLIEPSVRGKIMIFGNAADTPQHAYQAMLIALAINGYTVTEQGDLVTVLPARNAQRSDIPVMTTPPPIENERLITYIYKLKTLKADDVMKSLRILASKDGEFTTSKDSKDIIFSDYVSNIHRIDNVLRVLDGITVDMLPDPTWRLKKS